MDEKKRSRKKQLYHDIIEQVEFYFSSANLSKDRFMTHAIAENENGVELSVLLTFNKLKALTTDKDVLIKALKLSNILVLTENETRVKSKATFIPKENADECTIYVERLPLDANVDFMKLAFSSFGKIDYVSLPKFPNKKIKGFGFVEFADPSSAQKAIEEFKRNSTYLPIDMAPGNLRSICTLDKKTKEKMLKMRSRNFDYDECQNSSKDDEDMTVVTEEIENVEIEPLKSESNYDSEDNEKKRKHKTSPSTLERKKKKIKSEDLIQDNETSKTSESSSDKSFENPSDKSVETDAAPVKDVDQKDFPSEEEAEMSDHHEGDNRQMKVKKKRRQKKKPKKDRLTATSGLLILSKSDWKKLRNKYLNVQWEKMKSLKKHLYKCKQHTNVRGNGTHRQMDDCEHDAQSSVDLPNSVVKINLNEPVVDIKQFKAEIKSERNDIANIDIKEGATEFHIRFSNADAARSFTDSSRDNWESHLISGSEEIEYWSKIHRDRKNKLDKRDKKMNEGVSCDLNSGEVIKDIPKGLKEKPILTITPGTIVSIHTSEPVIDLKQFKKDIKSSCKDILYIDVKEGSRDAFVRFDTAESARTFASSNTYGKGFVLSGMEEQAYWDKINEDRTNKFNKTVRPNKRGKQKIIKKAEKLLGKHILIEDPDDM